MKNFEPIAIVGIGCRFPGDVHDTASYWNLLISGIDAISEVPEDRWNLRTHFSADKTKPGKTYTRCGGFIKDIDQFDAGFFGISPREAACMDPQQRILLETTWEAFADAGIDVDQLAGTNVGTFMGIFTHDYNNLQLDTSNRELIDTHTGVGVSMSIVANRLSYAFDFTGPSLTLDTACSSSLVALHLACQSIQNGESHIAIAGGANALIKPEFTIATSKASMLSPDGRCKSFDASANGYVRSEGAGVVVLKPLSAARRDGDSIYAVIKGTVVNQDGKSNGITVPNQRSQKAALRKALEIAGVAPEEISYAEAHGTGTFVGDPIEANSIGSVLGEKRSDELIMGSVKSNIGHLEAASGMASLIKVALSLKNGQIPPNLHFNSPNPQIEFEKYHLRVPTSPENWSSPQGKCRHACLNSFGFGGTNATVILAESPPPESVENASPQPEPSTYILPLSAESPEALKSTVSRYHERLVSGNENLRDLCFSAATRVSHRSQRVALIASNKEEFLNLTAQYLDGNESPLIVKGNNAFAGGKLAFVFSGMGTQWWAMGRQLLQENALFRETIETCDQLLSKHADWSLLEELERDEENSRINTTQFAQPAIFAVEIALAKVWESFGIVPDLVCGHSVGEIAAAYITGALTLEDAIKVIFYRSLLQQKTAGMGGMLAVSVSKNNAAHLISSYEGRIAIAAVNSPSSVTLAGELSSLKRLEKELTADKIFCRLLKVEVPFHCAVMDMIKDELISSLQSITPRETKIPLYSTVTGGLISGTELNAGYWWKNVREPVEFAKTIRGMNAGVFLEVSPHTVLIQSINESLGSNKKAIVLGSIKRKHNEAVTMAATLGSLYTQGYPLNWKQIIQGQFVKLPAYPWQRQSHWQESEVSRQDRIGTMARRTLLLENAHPLLGHPLKLAQKDDIWESGVSLEEVSFLKGHQIHNTVIFPGAGFIEMALAATFKQGRASAVLENFSLEKALVLKENAVKLQSVLSGNTFSIYSEKKAANDVSIWTKHASAKTIKGLSQSENSVAPDLSAIRQRCTASQSKEDLYQYFTDMGFNYTGNFHGIESFQFNTTEALAHIQLNPQSDEPYKIFPPLLDNGFQALLGIISCAQKTSTENRVFLPMQIARIVAHHHTSTEITEAWCHAQITESTEQGLKGDLRLYDNNGKILISIEGLYCLSVDKSRWDSLIQAGDQDKDLNEFYQVKWSPLVEELQPESSSSGQQWIIYGNKEANAAELSNQLKQAGHFPILLAGKGNPGDIEDAFKAIDKPEDSAGIVYLSALDIAPLNESTDPTCGCGDLLNFIQTLNKLKLEKTLWIVTQGAQFIYPESSRIEQSPIWGFAQVIALEQPQLQCHCLDLDPDANIADNFSFLQQSLTSNTREDRLAFRKGKPHKARLTLAPFAVDKNAASAQNNSISSENSYLITGAFGGLGRLITQRLIDKGARHLILMGRRGARGNEAWIGELTAGGTQVLAVAGDVSKQADVKRVIEELGESMPPLRGIIHAAGILDDGVISQQSPARFASIMGPKVQGSWYLHEATLDIPLDFFVCFSSIASLIGSPGQSNYAAGNAFMDTLAPIRQSMGLAATSINWGPWVGDGMAAAQLKRLAGKGFEAIEQEHGLDVFEALLTQENIAQIGVSPIQWTGFFAAFPEGKSLFFSEFFDDATNEPNGSSSFLDQLDQADDSEKPERLLCHIEGIVNAVFGFNTSGVTDRQRSLFDNGLDSLMALEIKNRLESSLQIPLPSTLLFERPNVEALGQLLSQEMGLSPTTTAESTSIEEDELLKDLDAMSDEELSALLENELNN